jgi:hypothetical protein
LKKVVSCFRSEENGRDELIEEVTIRKGNKKRRQTTLTLLAPEFSFKF